MSSIRHSATYAPTRRTSMVIEPGATPRRSLMRSVSMLDYRERYTQRAPPQPHHTVTHTIRMTTRAKHMTWQFFKLALFVCTLLSLVMTVIYAPRERIRDWLRGDDRQHTDHWMVRWLGNHEYLPLVKEDGWKMIWFIYHSIFTLVWGVCLYAAYAQCCKFSRLSRWVRALSGVAVAAWLVSGYVWEGDNTMNAPILIRLSTVTPFSAILFHVLHFLHQLYTKERKMMEERVAQEVDAVAKQGEQLLLGSDERRVLATRRITQEIISATRMVSAVVDHLLPDTLKTNSSQEYLASCSVPAPTTSVIAVQQGLKHIAHLVHHLEVLNRGELDVCSTVSSLEIKNASSQSAPQFDAGELLQSVGDIVAGLAATAQIELIIYHDDASLISHQVFGDVTKYQHFLLDLVKMVIRVSLPGDCIELGLRIEPATTTHGQSEQDAASERTRLVDCTFVVAHTSKAGRDSVAIFPDANESMRMMAELNGRVEVRLSPNGSHILEATFSLASSTSGQTIPNRGITSPTKPSNLAQGGHALEKVREKQPTGTDRGGEPSVEELCRFANTLEQRRVMLYATRRSVLATHVTKWLELWGAEVTTISINESGETIATDAPQESIRSQMNGASSYSSEQANSSGSSTPQRPRRMSGHRNASFVVIDDNIAVLDVLLKSSWNTRQPRERRGPSSRGENRMRNRTSSTARSDVESPVTEKEMPLGGTAIEASATADGYSTESAIGHHTSAAARLNGSSHSSSAYRRQGIIIYFTSLSSYPQVRQAISRVIASMPIFPYTAPPCVLIIPKPVGPRRFLTSLYTAIMRPQLDRTIYTPLATPPVTPGVWSLFTGEVEPNPWERLAEANSATVSPDGHRGTSTPMMGILGHPKSNATSNTTNTGSSGAVGSNANSTPGTPGAHHGDVSASSMAATNTDIGRGSNMEGGTSGTPFPGTTYGRLVFDESGNPDKPVEQFSKPIYAIEKPTTDYSAPSSSTRSGGYPTSTRKNTEFPESSHKPLAATSLINPSHVSTLSATSMDSSIDSIGTREHQTALPTNPLLEQPLSNTAATDHSGGARDNEASRSGNHSLDWDTPSSRISSTRPASALDVPPNPTDIRRSPSIEAGSRKGGYMEAGTSASAGSVKPTTPGTVARRHAPHANPSTTSNSGNNKPHVVIPPINVLIVEDNPINQMVLATFLRKRHIKCAIAKDGREAVEMWKNGKFHLVLMDIQLPVMDGIEATKEIRRLEKERKMALYASQSAGHPHSNLAQRHTPVIIVALTASALQSDRNAALAAGCNDFLTKPVSLEWLKKKISEWGGMQALINVEYWEGEEQASSGAYGDASQSGTSSAPPPKPLPMTRSGSDKRSISK